MILKGWVTKGGRNVCLVRETQLPAATRTPPGPIAARPGQWIVAVGRREECSGGCAMLRSAPKATHHFSLITARHAVK